MMLSSNTSEVIKKSGGVAEFIKLSSKDFKKELLLKVGEEASGLTSAENREEIIKELADIEAVTDEIKKVYGITKEELKFAKKANFDKKGGFDKKLFLVWSEDTGYKTNERRNE